MLFCLFQCRNILFSSHDFRTWKTLTSSSSRETVADDTHSVLVQTSTNYYIFWWRKKSSRQHTVRQMSLECVCLLAAQTARLIQHPFMELVWRSRLQSSKYTCVTTRAVSSHVDYIRVGARRFSLGVVVIMLVVLLTPRIDVFQWGHTHSM